MATGDQADQLARLQRMLPPWFGDAPPLLAGLLTGIASTKAFVFSLIAYAKMQTRIATATGGWLDMVAADFFGVTLRRGPAQSDDDFRAQIVLSLFRQRATRPSLIALLQGLTGRAPKVWEPQRVQDCGAYRAPSLGYGVAGAYGSTALQYQAFVTAYRGNGATDASLFAAVDSVRPIGTVDWTRISN